jgi:hypothetical protein
MKGYIMSKENQKEVEVINLPVETLTSCNDISVELSASHKSALSADDRMNTASALMLKLMGLKPDYYLLKQVQQVILNTLVNDHKLALTTSEKLFSLMLKQVQFTNAKFVKPSKPTKDGLRMSAKRKELKEKYVHEALESVEAKLAKVNRVIGQAFIDNVKPKEDDIKLQKELNEVKKIKSEKLGSEQKEQQKNNLKAMVDKVQKMLKIDSGRLNKNNQPIFEYSIVKLDFAYRCLENQEAIKKFLAEKK